MLLERVGEEFLALGVSQLRRCVFRTNRRAREFYRHLGWVEREDLVMMGKNY